MFFDSATGTAQQAATAVKNWWNALAGQLNNVLTFQVEPLVYTLDPATGAPSLATATTNTPDVGGTSFEILPIASQGLVQWQTGVFLGNRQVRGRTFLPGCTESLSTLGKPTAAWIATVGTAAATLIAAANADLVIWHRPTPAAPSGGSMVQVASGTLSDQWAVLTSRRD
jgi:hypothetical protein